MSNLNFPLLSKEQIEVRVQSVSDKGYATLLLYKDARVDQNILDNAVGQFNWQRLHEMKNGKLYCKVGIYAGAVCEGRTDWVWKEDVGVESNTEAVKGEASDAFKRACFSWGIGRELYTAPFTCVKLTADEVTTNRSGKKTTFAKFSVAEIGYDDNRVINHLVIVDSKGATRYTMGKAVNVPQPQVDAISEPKIEYNKFARLDEALLALENCEDIQLLKDIFQEYVELKDCGEFMRKGKLIQDKLTKKRA